MATAFTAPHVRGWLHRAGPASRGLVLTHGAGSDSDAPLLVAVAEAVAAAGITVLRCDLPFRQRRPKGPPSPPGAAADREGLRQAVLALRAQAPAGVLLGGASYGGRQASLLAAEAPELAQGLLLLSYPLHPPGRPAKLRTGHFPQLAVPALFVQGTVDPFGSIDDLTAAIAAIPAPTALIAVDKAGHDLKRGRFDLGPVVANLLALGA